jgi:hypothetical protein
VFTAPATAPDDAQREPAPDAATSGGPDARSDVSHTGDSRPGRGSAGSSSTRPGQPRDMTSPRSPTPPPLLPPLSPGNDAGTVAVAPTTMPPPTTAPTPTPIEAAIEPAVGHIVVQNPVWCEISVDGKLRGNLRNKPIDVPAGHHTVRCVNPTGAWTKETDVSPGATRTLIGTVPDIAVRLDIDATIDGKVYRRGAVVKLKPRRVEVVAGGKRQFITLRASCTLRDSPELECYQ